MDDIDAERWATKYGQLWNADHPADYAHDHRPELTVHRQEIADEESAGRIILVVCVFSLLLAIVVAVGVWGIL
jgi:hypothetical protein